MLWLWAALSLSREGLLGLKDPGSPWQPLGLRLLEYEWGEGRVSELQEPTYLICFWRIWLGLEVSVCSAPISPTFLPPSLFPLFISFDKHLLSFYHYVPYQSGYGRLWCSNKHPPNSSGIRSQDVFLTQVTCCHRSSWGFCSLLSALWETGWWSSRHLEHCGHMYLLLKRPLRNGTCHFYSCFTG